MNVMLDLFSALFLTAYAQASPINYVPEDSLAIETVWEDIDFSIDESVIDESVEEFGDVEQGFSSSIKDFTAFLDYIREFNQDPDLLSEEVWPVQVAAEALRASSVSRSDYKKLPGTVRFDGVFNGYDCSFIVPYDSYQYLTVIDGILYNTGNTAVSGRLYYPGEYAGPGYVDIYVYTLPSATSSTANVYRYGTQNYRTHYFLNSSSSNPGVTSQTMYGNLSVSDVSINYQPSQRLLYAVYIGLFFLGVLFICQKH